MKKIKAIKKKYYSSIRKEVSAIDNALKLIEDEGDLNGFDWIKEILVSASKINKLCKKSLEDFKLVKDEL